MKTNSNITVEELWELFNYDKDTGIFTRLISRNFKVKVGSVAGTVEANGYVVIKINGTSYKAHRLAWLYEYAEWPSMQIDHINRVRTDNRLCNLRDVSIRGNNSNCINNVKTLGTLFDPLSKSNAWIATIGYKGSNIHLGRFATEQEAGEAYQLALAEVSAGYRPSAPDVIHRKGWS